MKTTYEVEKFYRDNQGQWCAAGAKRFAAREAAVAYFASFRESQRDVLSNGIRIDLRERRGRKVLMQVGGFLERPTEVRRYA